MEFIDHFLITISGNELTHDCLNHYVALTSATVETAEVKGLIVY